MPNSRFVWFWRWHALCDMRMKFCCAIMATLATSSITGFAVASIMLATSSFDDALGGTPNVAWEAVEG